MFIDEKCSLIPRPPELSEMLSIWLNSGGEENGGRSSYKHFAALRLFRRQPPEGGTPYIYTVTARELRQRSTATAITISAPIMIS